jgi:hypothetical protein
VLYIFRTKAKHTAWWERTSARQWLAMIQAGRRHGLQMNLRTLRMLRATLLYDTLVLRLDRSVDRYQAFEEFRRRDQARWARQRWRRRMRGLQGDLYLRVEELAEAGEDLMTRAQGTISSPVLNFTAASETWSFVLGVMGRSSVRLLFLTAAAVAAASYARSGTIFASWQLVDSLATVVQNRFFQALIFLAVTIDMRQIVLRLRERDVRSYR